MIVSQINLGKVNDSSNGYCREIGYNTDNIASLPTEKNNILNSHRVLDYTSQNRQLKNRFDRKR